MRESMPAMGEELDIIIPVYNEGANIVRVLESFRDHIRTPFRILICYDRDEDDTLEALDGMDLHGLDVQLVKNHGRGALGAIVTGFEESRAEAVVVFPADDDYNAPNLDRMIEKFREGCQIVVASRFIPGGCMIGCPWLKATLVRTSAWALHHLAGVPTHDSTNGFRLFSRCVLEAIPIESSVGFAYSIELLVKCHRLGWKIGEVPVSWHERKAGQSRFRVLRWLPQYLKWFCYAFATTYLLRGPSSVMLKSNSKREVTLTP
jgi:dolichol-phosphate mannosyltransferase